MRCSALASAPICLQPLAIWLELIQWIFPEATRLTAAFTTNYFSNNYLPLFLMPRAFLGCCGFLVFFLYSLVRPFLETVLTFLAFEIFLLKRVFGDQ